MVRKIKKKGFTVAEMVIVLCMIGVVCAIALPAMRLYTPDKDKGLFRKAYATTEDVIAKMINDDRFYPVEDSGFSYIGSATVDGVEYEGWTKFRDVFRFFLDGTEDVTRPVSSTCFKTNDGIIWNIPNHDFSGENITISLYLKDDDMGKNDKKFEIYVSRNGRITIPPKCDGDFNMCKEAKMLKSGDIMKDKK